MSKSSAATKNRRQVTASELTFLKPSEMEIDQEVTGRYIDAKKDQFGGLGYKLETADGTIVVNGSGQLDALMGKVDPGENITIVYKGTTKLKSGKFKGKDAHQFELFINEASEADSL